MGKILIPIAAVRDEGTSYHYIPAEREIRADERIVETIESVLQDQGIEYLKVKTWTTDGPYRETPNKVKMRKDDGCLAVEMKTAAFISVAQFRGVQFGQLLYAGDVVNGSSWDERQWQGMKDVRERLFRLSVDI